MRSPGRGSSRKRESLRAQASSCSPLLLARPTDCATMGRAPAGKASLGKTWSRCSFPPILLLRVAVRSAESNTQPRALLLFVVVVVVVVVVRTRLLLFGSRRIEHQADRLRREGYENPGLLKIGSQRDDNHHIAG